MTVVESMAGSALPTAAIADAVREAAARHVPLRIAGRGHWLDAGRPVRAAQVLSLARCEGIVEYVPGDLTLTARAGTSLADIARVTAAERQWLALDPFGAATGTLGATVATASAGPLAHAFGPPRDNVLGVEAVTGDGRVVRGGGRVVKNVAGFDLTRLFTGSWGTLAVITEVTVRLRALPEIDESWALLVADNVATLDALFSALLAAAIAPLALELVNPALAARCGAGAHAALLVRLGGNADSVRAQRDRLADFGSLTQIASAAWDALRESEPAGAAVVRLSAPPSRTAEIWAFARHALSAHPSALLHASAGRGIVRCIIPSPDDDAATFTACLSALNRFDGTIIFERLPAASWSSIPNAQSDDGRRRLAARVKHVFDPAGILNPGILGGVS